MQRIAKQGKEVGNIDVKKKSGQTACVNIPKIPNITKKIWNDGVSLDSIAKKMNIKISRALLNTLLDFIVIVFSESNICHMIPIKTD